VTGSATNNADEGPFYPLDMSKYETGQTYTFGSGLPVEDAPVSDDIADAEAADEILADVPGWVQVHYPDWRALAGDLADHLRKTKVSVIADVRPYDWGIKPNSLFDVPPPYSVEDTP